MQPSLPSLLLVTVLVSQAAAHVACNHSHTGADHVVAGFAHACSDGVRSVIQQELRGVEELLQAIQPTSERCPAGWKGLRDSCYFIPPQKTTWLLAHHVCAQLDRRARLASVHPGSSQFVEALVDAFGAEKGVWMGLTRAAATAGGWVWTDGTPLDYTHWEPNQPSGGEEFCGHLGWPHHSKTGWHDNRCSVNLNLLCQIELSR